MKPPLLKVERKRQGWSQAEIAEALGVSTRTVSRWEQGIALPHPYYLEQLCDLFGKTAEELNLLPDIRDNDVSEEVSLPASFLADPAIPESREHADRLLGRDKLLMQIKKRLFAADSISMTALGGLPGIGKTALATALATDQQVQAHFRDGILWAKLGPRPNVLGQLARWGQLLGDNPSQVENIKSRNAWSRALQAAIGTRQILLIIDDVRTVQDALALEIGGPGCVHLLTTCLSQAVSALALKEFIIVPHLHEADSLALLARFVPQLVQQDPQGAQALVQAVGGLPLALTLMGKYLSSQSFTEHSWPLRDAIVQFYATQQRLGMSISTSSEQTRASFITTIPLNLHATIALCDQSLSPQAHAALCAMTVFPPQPESFSQAAALMVSQQSEEALDMLLDVGLLETCGPGRYMLHQAVTDYARAHSEDLTSQRGLIPSLPLLGSSTHAHSEDLATQQQQTDSVQEGHEQDIHLSTDRLSWAQSFCTLCQGYISHVASMFGLFRRLSWHSRVILSTILLATLVIIVSLAVFNCLLLSESVLVPSSISYEAEAPGNTLTGSASVYRCPTCSGDAHIRYLSGSATLQFNSVHKQQDGHYTLWIYYSNGELPGTSRSLDISVNGGPATTYQAPGLGHWGTVATLGVTVNLHAGNNTIKLSNPSGDAPDIDRIVV